MHATDPPRDMSCLSGLPNQIITFLSVPHEVLSLRHRVFREYAKIAVGPDFIHTLPSLIVFGSICVVFWRNPPAFKWLFRGRKPLIYKFIQVCSSWITINGLLWLWLIFQRVIYCSIWSYWSRELEYREISLPWWQKVWSTFYPPPPLEDPVPSSGFVSWIVSMLLSCGVLTCALLFNRVAVLADDVNRKVQDILEACDLNAISKKLLEVVSKTEQLDEAEDGSERSWTCDDCGSEISTEPTNTRAAARKREIHPISYGTEWTAKPDFSSTRDRRQEPKRKNSMRSLRTAVTAADEPNEREESAIRFSTRVLRSHRGCHTVIPSYPSDKSS